ncbi:MAG: carboxypeptidase regulatory-like domain-containing protein [Saprospiraceae bacterium]|nr:carboxypeptidase regulatory-like domain-containing protein [Saprospiraceae bacterium]
MYTFKTAVLFICLSSHFISAQTLYSLSGKITDNKGAEIDLAMITLTNVADSLIKAEYSDQDGSFEFLSVKKELRHQSNAAWI